MFGKPNDASRTALDAGQVAVGEHRLAVKPDLKEAALRVSKSLVICCLIPILYFPVAGVKSVEAGLCCPVVRIGKTGHGLFNFECDRAAKPVTSKTRD
jgi:hypothetical protein